MDSSSSINPPTETWCNMLVPARNNNHTALVCLAIMHAHANYDLYKRLVNTQERKKVQYGGRKYLQLVESVSAGMKGQ